MLPILLSSIATADPTPHTLVGVIERHGTRACRPGEWETRFYGQHWQAGWVDLVVDDALVAPHKGQIMTLTGEVTEARPTTEPLPEGVSPEHCPIPQMRSDMVESVDGMRYLRGNEPGLPGFSVTEARPFDGLTAAVRADDIHVVLTNTLGVPLKDVALQAQFEGCYGKPGSVRREARIETLKPGATLVLDVPHLVTDTTERPPRKGGNARHHALAAILVSAKGPSTWVGIDVRPRALGIEPPTCPKR